MRVVKNKTLILSAQNTNPRPYSPQLYFVLPCSTKPNNKFFISIVIYIHYNGTTDLIKLSCMYSVKFARVHMLKWNYRSLFWVHKALLKHNLIVFWVFIIFYHLIPFFFTLCYCFFCLLYYLVLDSSLFVCPCVGFLLFLINY